MDMVVADVHKHTFTRYKNLSTILAAKANDSG